MLSPSDQWCIEIDVTNACPHGCANCTRFTSLIREPFFMDLNTFRRAVVSMAGYRGVLGIMGGEPTIHPRFGDLAKLFREQWHPEATAADGREAIEDFGEFAVGRAPGRNHYGRRALFTSLGPGYYQHFEAIQDTFHQQGVNTHQNGCLHQAILVTRREAGIPDSRWRAIRDSCWVQRLWSASITPKGAYFCEIAGALDMLYAGLSDTRRAELGLPPSGGWPIEPGWWRRTPAEFGKQLGWCEVCGVPLATPKVEATLRVQQMSPWHAERLQEVGIQPKSPQVLSGESLLAIGRNSMDVTDADWYFPRGEKSRRACGHNLTPRHIEGIIVSVDCADELQRTLPGRVKQFDHCVVVTTRHDTETKRVAKAAGAEVVVTDACYEDGASFNKAAMLNAGLASLRHNDWVVFTDADIFFRPDWRKEIQRLVLNPGCLYYTRRWYLPSGATTPDHSIVTDDHKRDPCGSEGPWGYFQLWNVRASCLGDSPLRFPLCFPTAGTLDHWFKLLWPDDKIIHLPDREAFEVYHLWHGTFASRWGGRYAREATRWQYVGQSDLHGEQFIYAKLKPPCWLRRVEVPTTIEETHYYIGKPVRWAFPMKPRTLYAFSCRKESLDG